MTDTYKHTVTPRLFRLRNRTRRACREQGGSGTDCHSEIADRGRSFRWDRLRDDFDLHLRQRPLRQRARVCDRGQRPRA